MSPLRLIPDRFSLLALFLQGTPKIVRHLLGLPDAGFGHPEGPRPFILGVEYIQRVLDGLTARLLATGVGKSQSFEQTAPRIGDRMLKFSSCSKPSKCRAHEGPSRVSAKSPTIQQKLFGSTPIRIGFWPTKISSKVPSVTRGRVNSSSTSRITAAFC
jgi:hypothetical protein